jgi:hypothetical protein
MDKIMQMLRKKFILSPNNIPLNNATNAINAMNATNAINAMNATNAINATSMAITQFMKQNKLPFIQMYSLLGIVM